MMHYYRVQNSWILNSTHKVSARVLQNKTSKNNTNNSYKVSRLQKKAHICVLFCVWKQNHFNARVCSFNQTTTTKLEEDLSKDALRENWGPSLSENKTSCLLQSDHYQRQD